MMMMMPRAKLVWTPYNDQLTADYFFRSNYGVLLPPAGDLNIMITFNYVMNGVLCDYCCSVCV